ncbi:MAG: M20 family metallopeptidase [Alphaproteobacteria bacterium]|nr:M20 family metallopeptidase [Alphaproteobacteria bacterium]
MVKNVLGLSPEPILAGIREWVDIESPTTDPAAMNRMMDKVQGQMEAIGFRVERVPGRNGRGDHICCVSPWGWEGADPKAILMLSHLDTVHPIGTLTEKLPFRVEGDRAYGPGIADMKGGAYLGYNALRWLHERGERPKLPVVYVFNSDEEIGSLTSRWLIERECQRAKYALVTEPGRDGGSVVTSRRGSGRFVVQCKGRPSHSGSRPQDGRSAILEMAHQIITLQGMNDWPSGVSVNVGTIKGGTRANVVPEECSVEVDLRITTPAQKEEMARRILGLKPVTADVQVSVKGQITRDPYTKNAAIDVLYQHAKKLAAAIDFPLPEVHTGGGSDGNITAALGVPTLDALGADGAGGHSHEEHIFISKLVPRQTLMIDLLRTLA